MPDSIAKPLIVKELWIVLHLKVTLPGTWNAQIEQRSELNPSGLGFI